MRGGRLSVFFSSLGDEARAFYRSSTDPNCGSIARAYFIALTEWSLTPQYVNDEWSPELLWLMFHERLLDIERRSPKEDGDLSEDRNPSRHVTDSELFATMGINTGKA